MKRVRSLFETARNVEGFQENDEGYAGCGTAIKAGTPIWAAIDDEERRLLEGKLAKAVLFEIAGTQTWLWMRRSEFNQVARRIKPNA